MHTILPIIFFLGIVLLIGHFVGGFLDNLEKPKTITIPEKIKIIYHGMRYYSQLLTPGEEIALSYLSESWDTKRYYIFNNLILFTEDNSTTEIDHVILSPYGIFVIENKNYSGWIFGDEKNQNWMQTFPTGDKFSFQNPFRQNYKHIKVLQKYLPFLGEGSFKNIVIFNETAEFKTERPENLKYFHEVPEYIKSFDKEILSRSAFFMAIGKLSQLCQSTDVTYQEHINNLTNKNHV